MCHLLAEVVDLQQTIKPVSRDWPSLLNTIVQIGNGQKSDNKDTVRITTRYEQDKARHPLELSDFLALKNLNSSGETKKYM